MATNLETKIQRIQTNVTAALAKIAEKGVTVPDGSTSDDLEGLIESIPAGGGGTSVLDTCTVIIETDEPFVVLGIQIIDGKPCPYYREETESTYTFETLCGSVVAIAKGYDFTYEITNMTHLGYDYTYSGSSMGYYGNIHCFRVDAQAGGTATIKAEEEW